MFAISIKHKTKILFKVVNLLFRFSEYNFHLLTYSNHLKMIEKYYVKTRWESTFGI